MPGVVRSAPPLFVGSDVFRRAAFGSNHPLSIMRHAAVFDLARLLGWLDEDSFRACEAASFDELLEFHDRAYLRALQYADSEGRADSDVRRQFQIGTLENPVFPGLYERAATTVGGSILAARLALEGHVVFHPSGGTHHGRPDRACGFCYLNDPVFSIATLLDGGAERIMYVDLDAHHGDGVEEAWFGDRRVVTLSIHEEHRWPYSGTESYPEQGAYNLPVAPGLNDSELRFALDHAVLPVADACGADAFVICCGADGLAGDPLSKLGLSNTALWDAVMALVERGRPTVVLGGGGYNPWTVTRCWAGLWGRIQGRDMPDRLPAAAVELLRNMHCDLIDDDEVEPAWLASIADTPYPGPVGDALRSKAEAIADAARAAEGLPEHVMA